MIKKVFALILCALMLLPIFVACNKKSDVPEGMKSVTLSGEPFIFYVPEEWTDNRDSGISSAYYSINKSVMASARYYPCDADTVSAGIEAYVDKVSTQNSNTLKDYTLIETKKHSFGGPNGQKYEYKYKHIGDASETEITVIQYYTFYKNDVIILSMYVGTEFKDEYVEVFDKIRSEFKLCEKNAVNDSVKDKNTPKGMKKASDGDVQYVCYVPESWVTDLSDKLTYAYVDESGKPNITVTCVAPTADTTAEKYFTDCEVEYDKNIEGYARLSEKPQERKIAGRDALSYKYKAVYGGTEYHIMQTVLVYNDLVYSITYTARADAYDNYIYDVEQILANFRFR